MIQMRLNHKTDHQKIGFMIARTAITAILGHPIHDIPAKNPGPVIDACGGPNASEE